jgi:predicted esterase
VPRERHLAVRKTARYNILGEPGGEVREVWFVLHGHGQLSGYFIRHFAALADGTRLIVAPEALNRFYLEHTAWESSGQARVGATWMTREDRLVEIDDYIRYLDALRHDVHLSLGARDVRVVLLGFSQGVATAFRWAVRGRIRPDVLLAWTGTIPAELDERAMTPLKDTRVVRVLGDHDEMATEEAVAMENARFQELGLKAELVRFDGGHELNADVLRSIAV